MGSEAQAHKTAAVVRGIASGENKGGSEDLSHAASASALASVNAADAAAVNLRVAEHTLKRADASEAQAHKTAAVVRGISSAENKEEEEEDKPAESTEVKEEEDKPAESTEEKKEEDKPAESTEEKEEEEKPAESTEEKEGEEKPAESTEEKEDEENPAESTEDEEKEEDSSST